MLELLGDPDLARAASEDRGIAEERREVIRLEDRIRRREIAAREAAANVERGFDLKETVTQAVLGWALGTGLVWLGINSNSCPPGLNPAGTCASLWSTVAAQFWPGVVWGGILAASWTIGYKVWKRVTQ